MQYGYDVYTGTGENRKIPNVWAFCHDADEPPIILPTDLDTATQAAETETSEVIPVSEETADTAIVVAHEDDDMEQEKTIKTQIAKLIDVKSIITVMVMFCLCYLVMHGAEIPKDFMTVLIAIITFYFGYQSNKGDK